LKACDGFERIKTYQVTSFFVLVLAASANFFGVMTVFYDVMTVCQLAISPNLQYMFQLGEQ
jgi:hypothetical protein